MVKRTSTVANRQPRPRRSWHRLHTQSEREAYADGYWLGRREMELQLVHDLQRLRGMRSWPDEDRETALAVIATAWGEEIGAAIVARAREVWRG